MGAIIQPTTIPLSYSTNWILNRKTNKKPTKSVIIVYINLNADTPFLLIFSTEISIKVFAQTSISSLRPPPPSPDIFFTSLFSASALNLDQSKSSIIVS